MFLLRVKLITQGEKRETSTKTCNETMLHDKLKVFVSRISPPLVEHGRLLEKKSVHRGALIREGALIEGAKSNHYGMNK